MSRYILKFEKTGPLRYTSHLDLIRLFKRNFKKAGIDLTYSRGFNPHPKISFALALPLGHESTGEYLEIETKRPYVPDMVTGLVNSHLPYGIKILYTQELDENAGKLASSVEYACYLAILESKIKFSQENILEKFLGQDQIQFKKYSKKKNQEVIIDLKPLIDSLSMTIEGEKTVISMVIRAGSQASLNPDMLLDAVFRFDGIIATKGDYRLIRQDILDKEKKTLV